jgi:hypothetical protein
MWGRREEAARTARLLVRLQKIAALETDVSQGDWIPDRWKQSPTWRCTNHHVSRTFDAAAHGQPYCKFGCGSRVYLTFPGDRSGPLPVPGRPSMLRALPPIAVPPSQPGPAQARDAMTAHSTRRPPRGHRLT